MGTYARQSLPATTRKPFASVLPLQRNIFASPGGYGAIRSHTPISLPSATQQRNPTKSVCIRQALRPRNPGTVTPVSALNSYPSVTSLQMTPKPTDANDALRRAFYTITHDSGVACPSGCYLCRPLSQVVPSEEDEAAVFARAIEPARLASLANLGVDAFTEAVLDVLEVEHAN